MLKHDPPLLVERKSAELDKAVAAFFAKARAADEVFSLRDICRAITRSDDFGESYRRAVERAFRKSPPEGWCLTIKGAGGKRLTYRRTRSQAEEAGAA